uniref:Uncharacterized protein n=1 Tax=Trypanosoma vivax (strain Y486) TaxID=1055687 RepID=G0U8D2_TRYVY|nr:hypothetical protein TVY486_1113390 [Trypanosoma vivax Y486]
MTTCSVICRCMHHIATFSFSFLFVFLSGFELFHGDWTPSWWWRCWRLILRHLCQHLFIVLQLLAWYLSVVAAIVIITICSSLACDFTALCKADSSANKYAVHQCALA